MTVELITGQGSTDHIGSEDIGEYHAYTFGTGCYVLNGCECTVVDSNTVRIAKGMMLIEGRHVRVKGSEDLKIQSGSTGLKRNDLIVVHYTRDSNRIEDAPLAVIPGTATEGAATDPSYVQGSVLAEDSAADFPLYRIPIDGLAVGDPVLLMDRQEPFVGHKHSADEINGIALKAYPVGAYYISESATSPASLFGGTWTQVTGRFLRAANDTATGGSDTHTLTTAQLPKNKVYSSGDVNGNAGFSDELYTGAFTQGSEYAYLNLTYIGGGQSHNNMPSYKDVYVWRRTA
jgi:hypothetical protein